MERHFSQFIKVPNAWKPRWTQKPQKLHMHVTYIKKCSLKSTYQNKTNLFCYINLPHNELQYSRRLHSIKKSVTVTLSPHRIHFFSPAVSDSNNIGTHSINQGYCYKFHFHVNFPSFRLSHHWMLFVDQFFSPNSNQL